MRAGIELGPVLAGRLPFSYWAGKVQTDFMPCGRAIWAESAEVCR